MKGSHQATLDHLRKRGAGAATLHFSDGAETVRRLGDSRLALDGEDLLRPRPFGSACIVRALPLCVGDLRVQDADRLRARGSGGRLAGRTFNRDIFEARDARDANLLNVDA